MSYHFGNAAASKHLLATKLYIPQPSPHHIQRPHLIQRLNTALRCKLVLVTAPAGFGKTSAVVDWVKQLAFITAWLSLDEADNDPNRFMAYLIASVQNIIEGFGEGVLASLQSSDPPPQNIIATLFINELSASSRQLAIVLDGYQEISAPPVHELMGFLIEHAPPNVHWVITSRTEPPLSLARLRVRGYLYELQTEDLRFNQDETVHFLQQQGIQLHPAALQTLIERTEGWIAGIQLAALYLQREPNVNAFLESFHGDDRYIGDYLLEEALQTQPSDIQQFLLQTSILERLHGDLCAAITGRDDAQRVLESLDEANLFIVPLDNRRQWFRYHQLFAELLRARLSRLYPQQVAELHRRASQWYQQQGLPIACVRHALLAGDYEIAAEVIEAVAMSIITRGQYRTVRGWLEQLPDDIIRQRPQLGIITGWMHIYNGQFEALEHHLNRLASDAAPPLQGKITALRAIAARINEDVPQALAFGQQALDTLAADDYHMRSTVLLNSGQAYMLAGDVQPAMEHLQQAQAVAEEGGIISLALVAHHNIGRVRYRQGLLHEAYQIYREALAICEEMGDDAPAVKHMIAAGLAEVLYEWNRVEEAADLLQKHLRLLSRIAFVDHILSGYAILILSLLQLDRPGDAFETMQRLEQTARHIDNKRLGQQVASIRAFLWMMVGNIPATEKWAESAGISLDDEATYYREADYLSLARLYMAKGEVAPVIAMLARFIANARKQGRMERVILMLALQAAAYQINGEQEKGVAALNEAMQLGDAQGFIRSFVDIGEPIIPLLQHIARHGPHARYASQLLSILRPQTHVENAAQLSARELEVLQLVARGYSNRAIARELFVSLGTVKKHINNIFGKLDATNRTEAVSRARDLGLLD